MKFMLQSLEMWSTENIINCPS